MFSIDYYVKKIYVLINWILIDRLYFYLIFLRLLSSFETWSNSLNYKLFRLLHLAVHCTRNIQTTNSLNGDIKVSIIEMLVNIAFNFWTKRKLENVLSFNNTLSNRVKSFIMILSIFTYYFLLIIACIIKFCDFLSI